jgi:hypothetical protein
MGSIALVNLVMTTMPLFRRYIGIDYSGAETPCSGLKGLRVYAANQQEDPVEVLSPPGPPKYWSRAALAEWLASTLAEGEPALVGIDHGFSFPLRYFEVHHLLPDWPSFLDDFQAHWPTDGRHRYVDFVRNGSAGDAASRSGLSRWRRLTEERCGAKSVFHFDVPGSVAKSTHAGLPWLRYLRQQLGDRLHCWPFDGWDVSAGKSVLAEAYPSLWKGRFPAQQRTPDQQDAYTIAAMLQQADHNGQLIEWLQPELPPNMAAVARVEGWILGVPPPD